MGPTNFIYTHYKGIQSNKTTNLFLLHKNIQATAENGEDLIMKVPKVVSSQVASEVYIGVERRMTVEHKHDTALFTMSANVCFAKLNNNEI